MPVSIDQFTRQLADSSLLSPDDVQTLVAGLPPNKRPQDGEQLARELVRQKKLTAFQAQQIYAGKGKSLVLGNYLILDKLGQGGMGMVLKAEHRRMDRLVALKVLSPAVTKTPAALARFQREVKAAARLIHQNIVPAFDADEAGGTHFLVMEYIEGADLASLIKKNGPMPLAKTMSCVVQAARGLEFAHSQGVIHRDIKPANLLLDNKGTLKILDMGLARLDTAGALQDDLTGSGQIMGTVDYMAPEQAVNTKRADHRADIYSLGVTLWFLLTGKPMYAGETPIEKLMAHQSQPIPSLHGQCAGVSQALEAVFNRMVAKTPEDRYQSMGDCLRDLSSCAGSASSSPSIGSIPGENTRLDQLLREVTPLSARADQSQPTKAARTVAAVAATIAPAGSLDVTIDTSSPHVGTNPDLVIQPSIPKSPRLRLKIDGSNGLRQFNRKSALLVIAPVVLALLAGLAYWASRQPQPPTVPDNPAVLAKAGEQPDYQLSFNGNGNYVTIPTLRFGDRPPYTIEFYITPRQGFGLQKIVSCWGSKSLWFAQLGETWEPGIGRMTADGGSDFASFHAPSRVGLGQRVHLAMVYDQENCHLYENGKAQHLDPRRFTMEAKEFEFPSLNPNGSPTTLGAGGDLKTEFFAGEIDELRISSTARYQADFAPPVRHTADEQTLALYHFDEGKGEVLADSSGNNHHGKIVGARWLEVERQSSLPPPPAIAPFDAAQAKDHQVAWATYLNVPVEYTNSIGMKFRLIPPGEFMMGSTPEEIEEARNFVAREDHQQACVMSESPQHKAILTRPLFLGVHEVTQAEYERVMGQNPSSFAAIGAERDAVAGLSTSAHPVDGVCWNDAAEFCSKLSEQEEIKPFYFRSGETVTMLAGTGYRLPTEAEWEFACRAGTTTKYWIGDKDEDLTLAAWCGNNSGRIPHAVGGLKANPWGLYDIHGNIMEWVQDRWKATYYGEFQAVPAMDPNGPSYAEPLRVARGGDMSDTAIGCRSSDRDAFEPTVCVGYLGFRVALTVDAVRQATRSVARANGSIDVLSLVDVEHDNLFNNGRWEWTDATRNVLKLSGKQAHLQIPLTLVDDYRLRMRVQKLADQTEEGLVLGLRVAGHSASMTLGYEKGGKIHNGFEPPHVMHGDPFPSDREFELEVTVRGRTVLATFDGKTIFQFDGDPRELVGPGEQYWKRRDATQLSLGAAPDTWRISAFQYFPLTD